LERNDIRWSEHGHTQSCNKALIPRFGKNTGIFVTSKKTTEMKSWKKVASVCKFPWHGVLVCLLLFIQIYSG